MSLPPDVVAAVSPNSGASGFSLRSPAAPSRSLQGGFQIVRKDRSMVDRDVGIETDLPGEDVVEAYPGWRGYLHEKGPSRVVVEAEENQEIQPLDDAVWELIMGLPDASKVYEASPMGKTEIARIEGNAITLPMVQIANQTEDKEPSVEEADPRIHREAGDTESAMTDDSAESYRQLMELFSQPMFVTPTQEMNDIEGRVSFRIPQTQTHSPTIRQGSRARFEIRRQ